MIVIDAAIFFHTQIQLELFFEEKNSSLFFVILIPIPQSNSNFSLNQQRENGKHKTKSTAILEWNRFGRRKRGSVQRRTVQAGGRKLVHEPQLLGERWTTRIGEEGSANWILVRLWLHVTQ